MENIKQQVNSKHIGQGVSFPQELLFLLQRMAKEKEISFSALVCELIEENINEFKNREKSHAND